MKLFRIMMRLGLAAGLGLAVATGLRASDGAAPASGGASKTASEFAAVEQFLDLSDAQLDEMLGVIRRIRAMSPAERAALRREIAAFRQLPEPQRQQLRRGWGQMPRDLQEDWREMMASVTPQRHEEIRAKLQSLPPDEKVAYRRELVEAYRRAKAEAAKPGSK